MGIFDFYRGLADLADDQLDAAFDEIFAVNVKSHLVSVHVADHAGSYVFLASDRACGITGTVLHSDGGIGVR